VNSRIKKRIALIILAGVAIFILFCLASAIHFAKTHARQSFAISTINTLAAHLEIYRADHQAYPASLPELISGSDADSQRIISKELKPIDELGLTLTYQPGTNGFELSVTGVDSWHPKNDIIVKTYKIGEALNGIKTRAQ
jgi:hypothetical protein